MKVIITGTTGMIGEGVLLECLLHPEVSEVLSVSRRPCGKSHPKLKEYIVADFLTIDPNDEKLKGYDACFFCAGISSVGISMDTYKVITYDTTLHFAKALHPNSAMSFVYVSGGGTDSSEKGRMQWARIKGKTENDLMKLPFKQVFGYRIGLVKPADGQQFVLKYYTWFSWMLPAIKLLFPFMYNTMKEVTNSMVYVSQKGYEKNIIHVKDIHRINKLIATARH